MAVILKTVRPIRVYVVRTLVERLTLAPIHVSHPKIRGALVYPRPRVLYLQSPIPYEAVRVICLEPLQGLNLRTVVISRTVPTVVAMVLGAVRDAVPHQ